uniref:Uncharacterized protein n=1 Tax=Rhizophora mucronata TaxID=61149 RepID=A0A2P2R0E4_RHIMU
MLSSGLYRLRSFSSMSAKASKKSTPRLLHRSSGSPAELATTSPARG